MERATQEKLFARYRRIMDTKQDEWAPSPFQCPIEEYVDPQRLRVERERLFRGSPVMVAMTADVPKALSAYATDVDGIPLLVLRDKGGQARVFVNACRHRGTKMIEGRKEIPPVLVCPYHAWTYRPDGSLYKRPQAENCFSGLPVEDLGLRQLPSDEAMGLIFARLDGLGRVDAREWLGTLAPELAGYGLENYHHVDTVEHSWDFNWKIAVDTFLEAYHVFSLHKKSIHRYISSWPMLMEPRGRHLLTMTPWRTMETQVDAVDALSHSTIQHLLIPNVLITHQIDHIETWQFYPDGDDPTRCVTKTTMYSPGPPQSEKELAHWTRNLDVLMNVITKEDFPECAAMQRAMNSGGIQHNIVFGQNEPGLIHFHRALTDAIMEPCPS